MYGKSPERRRRQKVTRPPTFRVENEQNPEEMPQYFQISVNVIEARKLAWCDPHSTNSYIVIVLGKKKFRSNIKRNMKDPYYNECFVYEMYASIKDMQQSSIWVAVLEPRCCAPSRLLGEATIELGAIWAQPHHQVFHKWAQLMLPRESTTGPVGFLKMDISIVFRGEIQVMPAIINKEPADNNLLLPTDSEQQRANYLITVYGAFGLPSGAHCHGDRRYGKPPSTFVRVTFCGLVGKTAVQHRNSHPMYSEQISIVEMFPNICQMIRFEVCSAEGYCNKVLASTHLKLCLVSHDGENGFLPTFGPSLLHMYGTTFVDTLGTTGEDGPYHRGALLVSLNTSVPYYQQSVRSTSVEPVRSIKPEHLWVMEDFCIYCPILEVSMLDCRITGKISGVALAAGEINIGDKVDAEFSEIMTEIKSRKLHYTGSMDVTQCSMDYGYLDFQNGYPVLQLSLHLPDFRFRMFRNNMVNWIVANLESSVTETERRLKTLEFSTINDINNELNKTIDNAAGNILKFLEIVQCSSSNNSDDQNLNSHNTTELDQKQMTLQKEEMEKVCKQILKRRKADATINLIRTVTKFGDSTNETKKGIKLFIAEIKSMIQNLRNLVYKSSEGWPDIVIWLLNDGSRVAYARIPTAEIIYSKIPERCGYNCGKIQTVLLKPMKCPRHAYNSSLGCNCVAGKIELLFWMGLYKQNSYFEHCLPDGMNLRVKGLEMTLKANVLMLECRIFIYKAKLNKGLDNNSNLPYAFMRVNVLNNLKDTIAKPKSVAPVWNQILRIQRMLFTSQERIMKSPPVVLVELYESDLTEKHVLLGRFQIQPVVNDKPGYEHTPKLQWHEIYRGVENVGQVLIAAQLLQVPEKLMKSTIYSPVEESFYSIEGKDYNISEEELETLPLSLIPKSTSYKVDVYWWGLRDVSIARKPCVVLEMDELTIKSDIISDKKINCNFPNGRSSHNFEGPLNDSCTSSLNIKLYDSGTFGRTMFLGTNIVKNPNKYIVQWIARNEREASLKSVSIMSSDYSQISQTTFVKVSSQSIEQADKSVNDMSVASSKITTKAKTTWRKLFSRKEPTEEELVLLPVFAKQKEQVKILKKESYKQFEQDNWWIRYYSSTNDYNDEEKPLTTNRIKIYDSELEAQPEFSKFRDWCSSLKFYNGQKTGIPEKDEQLFCGILKVGIAIYKWPPPSDTIAVSPSGVDLNKGYFDDLPNNEPRQFITRVYIVKGMELKKKVFTGKSDTYVLLNCGKNTLGDQSSFVRNTINPIFGKMYELRCTFPEDYLLTISLYDHDAVQPDELIGSTVIDLENRIYTKHRACTGLATQYNMTGSYKWRDCVKPSKILEDLCSRNHLPPPLYPDFATVIVNGVEYRDCERNRTYDSTSERKENICLTLLHQWHTLPLCGYHLVPEHVETRSLINPDKPGFVQGKIQMWVDMFDLDTEEVIPPPVNIDPQSAKNYELRLIIWNVLQLKLDESPDNNKYPDIYVRAWIGAVSQAQDTDIHSRCVNGEASFNWRMIFDFQYQLLERKIIIKEKGPFTEHEEKVPPTLVIQVMDTDAVLANDSIGTVTLNLNFLPRGAKLAHQCTLEAMDIATKINLFSIKSIRAWWPLVTIDLDSETKVQAGVIDMELLLLPREKALLMPVGLGRNSPNALPEPHDDSRIKINQPTNIVRNLYPVE